MNKTSNSTGNAFAAFTKFNGKNCFVWKRNMETQPRALGQWEVVDGTFTAPTPYRSCEPDCGRELRTECMELAVCTSLC
jgi:hypothetical protein